MSIRNAAIIVRVDHGKTTLVNGLLKQSKTFRAIILTFQIVLGF